MIRAILTVMILAFAGTTLNAQSAEVYESLAKSALERSPVAHSEFIGEIGAQEFAKSQGYVPILTDAEKSMRQGFDQVYRHNNRLIVVEAKGGNSRLGMGYGYAQGTPEWAREVSKMTLRRSKATSAELTAALEVLYAYRKGTLTVETIRSKMVDGELRTIVEKVIRTDNIAMIRRLAVWLSVAAESYVRITKALEIETSFLDGLITLEQRDSLHLGNIGGALGGVGAAVGVLAMITPQGICLTMAIGGASYIIGDFVGSKGASYLADWLTYKGISLSRCCEELSASLMAGVSHAWSQAKEWGHEGYLIVRNQAGDAMAWTSRQGQQTWDMAKGGWYWAGDRLGEASSWSGEQFSWLYESACEGSHATWDWTKEGSVQVAGSVQRGARSAWGWMKKRSVQVGNVISGKAGEAATWASEGLNGLTARGSSWWEMVNP